MLQNYAEGWTDGKWEEKVDERPCIEKFQYSKDKQGYYRCGSTGELHNTTALFVCIQFKCSFLSISIMQMIYLRLS